MQGPFGNHISLVAHLQGISGCPEEMFGKTPPAYHPDILLDSALLGLTPGTYHPDILLGSALLGLLESCIHACPTIPSRIENSTAM